jgi:multicomponent Na+:H+ antiporter subunit B
MTVISETTAKGVLPVVLVTAAALFAQGHQLPGGGFIAGVLTVVGFALVYIVFSIDYVESVLPGDLSSSPDGFDHAIEGRDTSVMSLGLVVAISGGLVSVLLGLPFLTQEFVKLHLPLYGEYELASAVGFDLGVYLVVIGGLMAALSAEGEQ